MTSPSPAVFKVITAERPRKVSTVASVDNGKMYVNYSIKNISNFNILKIEALGEITYITFY